MMNFKPEQFAATQQANLEVFQGLTTKAFAGFEKMIELNMAASKALLGDSFAHAQAVLAAKDPKELMELQASLAQPLAEKATAYGRHVQAISADTSADLTKAFESKVAEAQSTFTSAMDNLTKNAPAGSEAAVAAFKNALSTSQNAMETAQKAVKQAMTTAESNFTTATEQAVKAASKVTQK